MYGEINTKINELAKEERNDCDVDNDDKKYKCGNKKKKRTD